MYIKAEDRWCASLDSRVTQCAYAWCFVMHWRLINGFSQKMCCLGIIRKSRGDLCKPDVATVIKAEKGGGEGKPM